MSAVIRIMTSDDIHTDADLARYIRQHQQILNRLGYEYAVGSAVVRSMLKDADKRAGQRRRYRVARPLAFAAGSMILGARQLALVDRRFREAYANELYRGGRRTTTRRRPGMVFS